MLISIVVLTSALLVSISTTASIGLATLRASLLRIATALTLSSLLGSLKLVSELDSNGMHGGPCTLDT